MDMKLRTSVLMENNNENEYIRIPKVVRDKNNIKLNDFLEFRRKDGNILIFKILSAYTDDIITDNTCGFITQTSFDLLDVSGITELKEINVVNDITLGCDPEFFLVNKKNGELLHANKFFHNHNDRLGYDHGGLVAELRPKENINESIVCRNLFDLIKLARCEINKTNSSIEPYDITMHGASHYSFLGDHKATCGFHLHYGIPRTLINSNCSNGMLNQIVKCLDYYVGIPSIIPEGNEDSYRRSELMLGYGKPSDYRKQYGFGTLEYRVPGGAILKHPVLTEGILSLGAVVVEDVISRLKKCTGDFTELNKISSPEDIKEIYNNLIDTREIYSIICSKSIEGAHEYISKIETDVKKMLGYYKYERKEHIEDLFKYIKNRQLYFSNNIEENWYNYYKEAING